MRDWESSLSFWAQPPSATEQARLESAESKVRAALARSRALQTRNYRVFVHGSYRNRTNVRQESDVDVGIVCTDTFFYEPSPGMTEAIRGISPATYDYADFKNDVGAALVDYFGRDAVTRGSKAFDVHATSSRVDADVAPFFAHRRYISSERYHEGVELRTDSGQSVVNWPDQHYDNGVAKNDRTRRAFKAMVRILKRLRNEMNDQGVAAAAPIPGLLLECLVFNVPDNKLGHSTHVEDFYAAIPFLWSATKDDAGCTEWGEVNEFKYLFRGPQTWTRQQAFAFVDAAWDYVGVK